MTNLGRSTPDSVTILRTGTIPDAHCVYNPTRPRYTLCGTGTGPGGGRKHVAAGASVPSIRRGCRRKYSPRDSAAGALTGYRQQLSCGPPSRRSVLILYEVCKRYIISFGVSASGIRTALDSMFPLFVAVLELTYWNIPSVRRSRAFD